VRLSAHQERILNALVEYRHANGEADASVTWSGTVPNRSEFIRSLIREDYKRAVTQGMKPVER
jgi:hypothetical protein